MANPIVCPLVLVAAEVGAKIVHVVGEQHRMLVHVDQREAVHQALEARLLRKVERHDLRGHTSDLLGHTKPGHLVCWYI